jgi:hypothetical protein
MGYTFVYVFLDRYRKISFDSSVLLESQPRASYPGCIRYTYFNRDIYYLRLRRLPLGPCIAPESLPSGLMTARWRIQLPTSGLTITIPRRPPMARRR